MESATPIGFGGDFWDGGMDALRIPFLKKQKEARKIEPPGLAIETRDYALSISSHGATCTAGIQDRPSPNDRRKDRAHHGTHRTRSPNRDHHRSAHVGRTSRGASDDNNKLFEPSTEQPA